MNHQADAVRVAVVGATGYTGAELMRLLLGHPRVRVTAACGNSRAGEPVGRVLPSLAGLWSGGIDAFDADRVRELADVAFCALPHGASAGTVAALRECGLPVLDLSADFRLEDAATYRTWYGEHGAPAWFGKAVYGLVETYREPLRSADLVAVPGCYPTSSLLPLIPLLRERLIASDAIIIDAKSGVSGAGRSPSAATHFSETAEGVRAYKVGGTHRHIPEIEQELSKAAGQPVQISFTPHLLPMIRGILSTLYLQPAPGIDAQACRDAARAYYRGSPSVEVLEGDQLPDTLWVRGSNRAHLAYVDDPRTGRLVALCAIDNLVKGAAGQAVQCMNLRMGFDEGLGLQAPAIFP